jgi:16S rRNA U1498 N3-methylase RsmE
MNLILLQPHELSQNDMHAVLSAKDPRTIHIRNHLRKKSGQEVTVGVVGGSKGKALLEWLDQRSDGWGIAGGRDLRLVLTTTAILQQPLQELTTPRITLVLALPFPKRLRALWPVISSFGFVTRIIIVRGQLSDADHCKTSAVKPHVHEPLIEEGMSQGGHTRTVTVQVRVKDVVSRDALENLGLWGRSNNKSSAGGLAKVFLDCGDEETVPPPARDVVLRNCPKPNDDAIPSAIVAVGPERGWSDEDARLFAEAGFEPASLGSSILRVDTAVIAGLGIVSAALEESMARKHANALLGGVGEPGLISNFL